MPPLPLVLASASPRRAALLRDLGLDARVLATDADETALPGEGPSDHVVRVAAAKSSRAVETLRRAGERALVLAADTVVVLDGEILGKPRDAEDARRMLMRLAGRTHAVMTAVRLARSPDGAHASALEVSRVRFRDFGDDLARWYVATGEPMDKAGAYGIQGLGVFLTEGIDGSWSNVVGLPLERLPGLFADLGESALDRISDARGAS